MGVSSFSRHQLTSNDLEMIEISWSFVKNKQEFGLNTMIKIFETSKEIKKLFLFASNLELAVQMKENSMVRNHAKQMISQLDKIVVLLTKSSKSFSSEQEKEQLIKLGQQHYHYGLRKDFFKIFENCFIKSLEHCLSVEIFHQKFETPWRKLIQFIFKKYIDGMNFEHRYSNSNFEEMNDLFLL